MDQINQYNPLALLTDNIYQGLYGTDRLGNPMTSTQAGLNYIGIIPAGRIGTSAVSISTSVAKPAFRRTANIGAFSSLTVPMQKRYVKRYAREGGIGLQGVRIKINRQNDLIRSDFIGSASGNTITLYPNAFKNPEELIRTLGHERTHIMQYRLYGQSNVTNNVGIFEEAAYGIEDSFVKYWKSNGGN